MKPLLLALTLTVAFSTTAQTPPSARDSVQGDAIRKLTKRERAQRIAKLNVTHQDFLADVEPIIQPAEIDLFLMLENDAQRDHAIDEFWRRRDRVYGLTNRSFRDIYYARRDAAAERFGKLATDRARVFLLHGPPNDVSRADCRGLLQPVEIWRYDSLPGLGNNIRLLFYKPRHQSDYRLWNPVGGTAAISELLATDPSAIGADDARRPGSQSQSASPYAYIDRIHLECGEGEQILRAVTSMVQARIDLMRIFEPHPVDDEAVRKILRSVVVANPDAPGLSAEFSVGYPWKDGIRTGVQMMLLVPRDQVVPSEVGGVEVYTIDVTGEVLRDGKLWERYRYRFNFPGDFEGEKLPVVIDRYLRPSDYLSRIKIIDAGSGAEGIIEKEISVPEIFMPTVVASARDEGSLAPAPPSPVDAAAPLPAIWTEPRLRLVPPPGDVVRGIATVNTLVTGEGISAVEFWLDGRKIAVRRAPPFAVNLDFGNIPRARRVRAVALNKEGVPLTGDEVFVNSGTDPFRVRIVSPRVAPYLRGMTRIEMDVKVPEGERLEALDLYWNETVVATLYDPPYVQTVDVPAGEGVAYLRAVATLKGSTLPPVEDVVIINTPAYMEELNVHLVEVPATVLVNGKPASHLNERSFRVFDEGKPVSIAKFEYVKNLPLSLGLAIDTSGSMLRRLEEAQKAGAQFLQNVMKPGDKAFLVAFDSKAELVQRWTSRLPDLHAGMAKLRAEDMTALYDAVVTSLFNFQGVRGQRALILLTDGRDTASSYSFDETIEYVRHAAVPIYAIGIGIRSTDADVRQKLSRLCAETGGSVYYIDQARDLQRIYADIETELRSQYILGFYPSGDVRPGSKWRQLRVEASEGKVRTIRGYFP
jgi:Ca-activated chloride channel homolog